MISRGDRAERRAIAHRVKPKVSRLLPLLDEATSIAAASDSADCMTRPLAHGHRWRMDKVMMFQPPLILALVGPIASCAAFTPADVAKPTSLTVEHALADVGRGFALMKQELREGDLKLGLFPCKITVKLNVTAAAEQGGKLVIDASTAPTTLAQNTVQRTVTASSHLEQTNTSSVSRGNTVIVEMYSIACTPKDTLAGAHPDKVGPVTRDAIGGTVSAPLSDVRKR